jgi:hypothetical protein
MMQRPCGVITHTTETRKEEGKERLQPTPKSTASSYMLHLQENVVRKSGLRLKILLSEVDSKKNYELAT